MDATTVQRSGESWARMGVVSRWLAVPVVAGALALGAVANGTFAQDGATASAPQSAGIYAGTCDAVGSSVLGLGDVAVSDDEGRRPSGNPVGSAGATEVLVSDTQLNGTRLDDLLAQPHAIVVSGGDGAAAACGEIGGYLYENEHLYLGLRAQNGSGFAGVAVIEGDDDDAEVDVTIFLVGDAAAVGVATPAS